MRPQDTFSFFKNLLFFHSPSSFLLFARSSSLILDRTDKAAYRDAKDASSGIFFLHCTHKSESFFTIFPGFEQSFGRANGRTMLLKVIRGRN